MSRRLALILLALIATSACRPTGRTPAEAESAESKVPVAATATAVSDPTTDPDLMAKLAAADRADGTEDKVIGKCVSCGLGMQGSAQHALHYGPYELHACSPFCKERLEKEPATLVRALEPTN
jgi:hypothetical protein